MLTRLLSPARTKLLLLALVTVLLVAAVSSGFGALATKSDTAFVSETSSTTLVRPLAPITLPDSAVAAPSAPLDTPVVPPPAAVPTAESDRQIELVGRESWDAASAAAVDQALAVLPASVQAELGNPDLGPVQIIVDTDGRTPIGYQPYGGPANFYETNDGHNSVVLYPDQGVLTVLHELGHAYNLRHAPAGNYASVLLDPEMQSFMAAAGWRVLTPASQLASIADQSSVAYAYDGPAIWDNLSHNDPLEDFANSFAWYFGDPQGLQAKSPARYAWLATLFGN